MSGVGGWWGVSHSGSQGVRRSRGVAPTGPGGEGESDDDPGGTNQADLGYEGEGVATSGKNTFTFPFF